jgi:hypothetical protein
VATFIEEIKSIDKSLRNFSAQTKGLDFWKNEGQKTNHSPEVFFVRGWLLCWEVGVFVGDWISMGTC